MPLSIDSQSKGYACCCSGRRARTDEHIGRAVEVEAIVQLRNRLNGIEDDVERAIGRCDAAGFELGLGLQILEQTDKRHLFDQLQAAAPPLWGLTVGGIVARIRGDVDTSGARDPASAVR